MDWLHSIFKESPEIALFLSLAIGYAIGQINFGKFKLGGVGGSLLTAVIISQVGVSVDNGVKSVMFALFIYAVGYDSGPQFFRLLNRKTLREIAMAIFLAASALMTVVICARIFHLDKGLAAGLAGGALTQSAIIGTAGDAISRLGLPIDQIKYLQSNVAIAYAVTYVFGSLGAIIVCAYILPKFMKQDLRKAAIEAEKKMSNNVVMTLGQSLAMPPLIGRAYELGVQAANKTIEDIEHVEKGAITIEKVKRGSKMLKITPELTLEQGDKVLVVGRRDGMISVAEKLGQEISGKELDMVLQRRQVVFKHQGSGKVTIAELRKYVDFQKQHGVYIDSINRAGQMLPVLDSMHLEHGDLITFYGSPESTKQAVELFGAEAPYTEKTDFVFMGMGLVVGLLIGLIEVRVGNIPLTLGSGGGCLLSGLLFGWLHGKNPAYGYLSPSSSNLLKDLGLAGFVAVVGLDAGLQAVVTVEKSGLTLFFLGVFVTIFPLILTMLFGRYVLRYDNAAIFAGALSGARSANPAFGAILEKTENSVPTIPFAVTYAIANVLLTLLGPLIIGLV